jgi:hypothetical protein
MCCRENVIIYCPYDMPRTHPATPCPSAPPCESTFDHPVYIWSPRRSSPLRFSLGPACLHCQRSCLYREGGEGRGGGGGGLLVNNHQWYLASQPDCRYSSTRWETRLVHDESSPMISIPLRHPLPLAVCVVLATSVWQRSVAVSSLVEVKKTPLYKQ